MSMKPGESDETPQLLKKLGLNVVKVADSYFIYGLGGVAFDAAKLLLRSRRPASIPLDWEFPWEEFYVKQDQLLWFLVPESNMPMYLPQARVLGGPDPLDERSITVQIAPLDKFRPPRSIAAGYEYYAAGAKGKKFHDCETARLFSWENESRSLVFQKTTYFDYLKTNLSLDAEDAPSPTLRKSESSEGRLASLEESGLANVVGINGLVFSNDGYLIYQRRNQEVLIRPGQLCSGFSGTVDWTDIEHAISAGGGLNHFDAERELREELGLFSSHVASRTFLGITRELIRGGAPEMFYSVDLCISRKEVLECIPKDKEGSVSAVKFGVYGSSTLKPAQAKELPVKFWELRKTLMQEGKAEISYPLQTNLLLWYQRACPEQVGFDALPLV